MQQRRQVIPRPARTMPGRPAPWATLAPAARRNLTLGRVRAALDSDRHVPHPEPFTSDAVPGPRSPAAVLVAMFEEGGEARVVLTRRAGHLRTHTGEVSFPGGRLEPGESPEAGARREASEEVGLEPGSYEVVGRLTPLSTLSSGATITPVVAVLQGRPVLTPNPDEVERVFDVALADLAADGVFTEERWFLPERPAPPGAPPEEPGWFPMWFFDLPEDTIWGATARMIVELLRLSLGT